MADSHVSAPGPTENNQPAGNPPNSTAFMPRQSQWKGRRGKPRCDSCRLSNLKCDRAQPVCNHCSWVNRDCLYTPLPTPAHRGIPRCDRCRHHNLKCDRQLPVCNFCAQDGAPKECNYTPKRRHKHPAGSAQPLPPKDTRSSALYPSASAPATMPASSVPAFNRNSSYQTHPLKPSETLHSEAYASGSWITERPDSRSKGKLSHRSFDRSSDSPGSDGEDDAMEADDVEPTVRPQTEASWIGAEKVRPPELLRSTSGSKPRSHEISRHLEPWYHAAFAPLPRPILQGIRTVNPSDMPTRRDFDAALLQFISNLSPELREISAFPPDAYANMAHAVVTKEKETLTERAALWTEYHHLRSGSRKYHLLLIPREQYFTIERETEDILRNAYVAEVDGEANKFSGGMAAGTESVMQEGLSAFQRIPVSPQIYDVLVYAHKKHGTSMATLREVCDAGIACITWPMVELFQRLCPRCIARTKAAAL
ncbi:hypothetical protein OF83DRAFT_842448 [Amylostereum chailletii]|nr:hypothetical protein OF83DRAFT_842448 [Amylostereum chailletii]